MVNEEAEKKAICRDYMRNMCSRGESCKYSHPEERLIFCHDYQNGKCKRTDCMFVHCSRDDEEHYNQFGELPPHLREPQQTPVCKDFLKGDCQRAVCRFRHLIVSPWDHQGHQDKRPRLEVVRLEERWSVEEENEALRRTVAELKKRVADLEATNEFLLEQNARMRLSELPTAVIPATVPVSIATVAGTPVSIAAAVQIPPVVTTVSQRHERETPSQALPIVSYPTLVARLPTIDSALH